MSNQYELAAQKADEIENELKALGHWKNTPPDPAIFVNMGAFGSNTMPFTSWLQFVLIPRIRQIIDEKDKFPGSSSVAVVAYRNLEEDRYETLNRLLSEFDALFN